MRLASWEWTPRERRCAYCGRGWYTWNLERIPHTECWIGMGFLPILLTELGDRYLRDDPVPNA